MPRLTRMSTATSNLINVDNRHLRSSSIKNIKSTLKDSLLSQSQQLTENRDPDAQRLQLKRSTVKRDAKEMANDAHVVQPSSKRGCVLGDITNKKPAQAKQVKAPITNGPVTRRRSSENKVVDKVPRVPPGIIDFDALNKSDPHQESNYAMHIFEYYKQREERFTVPDYLQALSGGNKAMKTQPEISETMRGVLVDWLVDVQESFEMNHETLYTAVRLVDLYLARRPSPIVRSKLQLVGITAFLLAAKLDERIPPLVDDFVYLCDDAYTRDDVVATEMDMFCVVGYDLGYPLAYRFLRRYARVCQISMQNLTFGRYILELTLLDYKFNVQTSESKLAAAVLMLVLEIKQQNESTSKSPSAAKKSGIRSDWQQTLQFYSGYTVAECTDLISRLHAMLLRAPTQKCNTVQKKYAHSVFHCVASIAVPKKLTVLQSTRSDCMG